MLAFRIAHLFQVGTVTDVRNRLVGKFAQDVRNLFPLVPSLFVEAVDVLLDEVDDIPFAHGVMPEERLPGLVFGVPDYDGVNVLAISVRQAHLHEFPHTGQPVHPIA